MVRKFDRLLPLLIPQATHPRLKSAMRYATSGGKRIRALLLIECATIFKVPRGHSMLAAAAIECLHAYSLIHDDLPSMDNAATRRGKASVHKKYDEATAILAGDALLTLAFEILARTAVHPDPNVRTELIESLAKAAGQRGMVSGQMMDLALEGRWSKKKSSIKSIQQMELLKTAKLFSAACEAGAILGQASKKDRAALAKYGLLFGQAFQIADDLKDIEEDQKSGKKTFVTVVGEKQARMQSQQLINDSEKIISETRFSSLQAIKNAVL